MTDINETLPNGTNPPFPLTGSGGLPLTALAREFYTSEEWFQKDLDRVFRRRWLFVCHVSEIAKTGDYTTFELANDSVVVVRDRDNTVHAFHNVCRHRGSRLCNPGSGNVKAFVCPFHAWTYNLDGSLRAAAQMRELDKSAYGAKKVWCEVWKGMVFINFVQDKPKTVAEYLRTVDFSQHHLDRVKVIECRNYVTEANWKINAETYSECYHCFTVHRTTLAKILDIESNHEAYADQSADDGGLEFMSFSADLRKGGLKPGLQTQTKTGQVITKKMLGDGSTVPPPQLLSWFPSFSVGAFPDYGFIIDWIPMSATRTNFRTRWFVHADAVEGVDYNLQEVVELADTFNLEDKVMVERQQDGVRSNAYEPGPYHNPLENDVRKYMRQYLDMVRR